VKNWRRGPTGQTPSKQGIETIGKEIEKAGKQIRALESSQSSSIQVSRKAVGSVDLSTAIIQVAKQNLPAVVYMK